VYNSEYDLFGNPLGRYFFGRVDKDLRYDADGGVTFHLQADAPGKGQKGNWLPTPRGAFNLFLRAYLPGDALIKQDYLPPAVMKVSG
jgi:hypothetical protein